MHDNLLFDARMDHAAFCEFDELCKRYPEMFAMDSSPVPDQVDAFRTLLMQTNYAKGLFATRQLQRAICALETRYRASLIRLAPSDPRHAELETRRHGG